MEKSSKEKCLIRAEYPSTMALKMHPFYRGKLQVLPRCSISNYQDFSIWYSPGVAAPCNEIYKHKEKVYDYTGKWNYVAIVSDGTRALGLGDIGPEASLPIMEGKALLFKYLGGVDAFPLTIGPKISAEEIIKFVKLIQPTFGGINLEDISSPKCFKVLNDLRSDPEVNIPVWHDDQQGTACVTLAGLMNALKIVGKKKNDVKIVFNGIGASNSAISHILGEANFNLNKALYVDSKGILYKGRPDLDDITNYKHKFAQESNPELIEGNCETALEGADILISYSVPGPNTINKKWISKMANDSIVFACANPVPEIFPWDAIDAGARVVATGRSDFPNQVNNSLGFPGIFRGTLDVRASNITDEMVIAAAYELAKIGDETEGSLSVTNLLPTMDHPEIYIKEAVSVGLKAIEQGIARKKLSKDELYTEAKRNIEFAQNQTRLLMKEGFIPPFTNNF